MKRFIIIAASLSLVIVGAFLICFYPIAQLGHLAKLKHATNQ